MKRTMIIGCALLAMTACRGSQPVSETPPTEPVSEEPAEKRAAKAQPVEELGTVDFETSCNDQAQEHFQAGLGRLHHMWYEKARESFQKATDADADCAMAQWGIAMTYYTPLWAKPTPEELATGARAARQAAELGGETDRERAFIAGVTAFFDDYSERDHATRAAAFRDAWKGAAQRDPDDIEAASFHALAILSMVPPTAETYDEQEQAGAILEKVLQREPNHPGGHHYLIHAYDFPPLAERAVPVAQSYSDIAPAVPHALHMPTHIFTRLGMWNEVIDWNVRSAEAAKRNPVDGMTSLHYFHALDYMVYAHLQMGEDRAAEEIASRARAAKNPQPHVAAAYTSAAIPARLALEKKDWKAAASVEPLHPDLAWENWPYVEAVTVATRAIGAVNEGNLQDARQELDRLETLVGKTSKMDVGYWDIQAEIYRDVVQALVDEAENRPGKALTRMKKAAKTEASMDKHPISPGRVINANEYLGELLLRQEQPGEALQVYEGAMERTPKRFHVLHGAAVSARESGDEEKARTYYTQLTELAADADETRPQIDEARKYLARSKEQATRTR